MTTDRAKEVVNNAFGAWYSEYIGCESYNATEAEEARDTAIKALDKVEKYLQAIDDIKTEINREYAASFSTRPDSSAFSSGLELAFEIVSKHTERLFE